MAELGCGTIAERKSVAGAGGTRADWLGVACSAGCAIHCATMPVLLAIVPSFSSIRLLADPAFHQLVAAVCTVLVIRAILPQWKQHRDWRVGGSAVLGLALLLFAAFVLPDRCCDTMLSKKRATTVTEGLESASDPVSFASVRRRAADDPLGGCDLPEFSGRSSYLLVSTDASSPLDSWGASEIRVSENRDNPFADRDRSRGVTETTYSNVEKPQAFAASAGHWSRPVVSLTTLSDWLGTDAAHTVVSLQHYLSPLGGVFLIIAHLLNLSLRRSEDDCCTAV